MSSWKATSVSGTVYCRNGGFVEVWKQGELVSVTKLLGTTRTCTNPEGYVETPWSENGTEWVDCEIPRVGFCFYFAGREDWRITAIIAKVEVFPSED